MTAIARELGMSRSALYRALKIEETTFEQIVDQARIAAATRLLQSGVSIKETAEQLGYSDPSAFSRAYKRWMGVNPRAMSRLDGQMRSPHGSLTDALLFLTKACVPRRDGVTVPTT